MALIHTVPQTDATVPPPVRESGNGTLPLSWLRSFDGTTRTDYKMFVPVAYAMQAMILAALNEAGIRLTTTGRYRIYSRQEALFLERFTPGPFNAGAHRTSPSIVKRTWNLIVWFLLKGMSMAATPGTSNHGWGIADDICEAPDYPGGPLISLRDPALMWLRDNAHRFGFALDTWEERWHWHWFRPGHVCELTQETVDVLHAAGVMVPDLSTFGFTAPAPTPPPTPDPVEDDDMTKTYIGRREDNGRLIISLNGVVASEVPTAPGGKPGTGGEAGIKAMMEPSAQNPDGLRDYFHPKRRDVRITKFDDIPDLDGSWVVAMGRLV